MRAPLVGLVTSLMALVGFTSTADASSTIDLIWAGSRTPALSSIATSSSTTLLIVWTNDFLSAGASVSLDYSGLLSSYSLVGFESNPNSALGLLPMIFAPITDAGGQIRSFSAGAIIPYVGSGLVAGQSYLLGTATFHKDGPGLITTGAFAFFDGNSVANGQGITVPDSQTTLGFTVHPVPEPVTSALLALGLIGLSFTYRRRTNTRDS